MAGDKADFRPLAAAATEEVIPKHEFRNSKQTPNTKLKTSFLPRIGVRGKLRQESNMKSSDS